MSSSVVNFDSKSANTQEFLSSGSFTVPAGVTQLVLDGCGGGGGGGSRLNTNNTVQYGSCGALRSMIIVDVTPLDILTVTIGAGGAGIIGAGTGGTGGDTTLGSVARFKGADGTSFDQSPANLAYFFYEINGRFPVGNLGYYEKFGPDNPNLYIPPHDTIHFTTPKSGLQADLSRGGVGGFGIGGAGGNGNGTSAAANTGGGGGMSSAGFTGGNGGSGKLIIRW